MDSKQQTLRVTGLPTHTQVRDVENFFADRIRSKGRKIIESVGPISESAMSQKMQTTVSFSSHEVAEQALKIQPANRRLTAIKGGAEHISLSHGFEDITTLHTSKNPATGRPDIDVVALHGLTGHAWNTFTTSELVDKEADRTRENNWLRDSLPGLLEQHHQQKIYSRVMSFGYNADVWMTKSVNDLDVPVRNLLHSLDVERQEDPSRPLFFVGHSLGGIVIKQAIVELGNDAMIQTYDPNPLLQRSSIFPVKGCMFFGVPHKGTHLADTASRFLSILAPVFNVNKNNVKDLRPKSQRFANISSEFRSVQSARNIPVISFYETVQYNHTLGLIVDSESAVYDYPGCPRPFGVNRDHKDMAKFSNEDDHALKPAVHFLATVAANAIEREKARSRPTIVPPPPPAPVNSEGHSVEDRFSILEGYDTVFLIDDSPSMRGINWELVQKILDYSIVMAARYDPDGIDTHFMNNTKANQDSIKDSTFATTLHHEPQTSLQDESDASDQDDARKHKAAFRLIRKKIVDIARKLDEVEAERTQVGVQFCQVGNDEEATEFFQYLDDRIKGRNNLRRDMVDTIKCQSELDLTESFFEKLLLGAIDKRLDRKKIETANPATYGQGNTLTMPHHSRALGTDRERQWSGDETLVGSSGRETTLHTNRFSTRRTLIESPTDAAQSAHTYENIPSHTTSPRHASPPSAGAGHLRRPTTFSSTIQETEEPELNASQRSSTFGSHRSHWWNGKGS